MTTIQSGQQLVRSNNTSLYPSFGNTQIETQNEGPRNHGINSKILGMSSLDSITLGTKFVESSLNYDKSTPILDGFTHLSKPVDYFFDKNINGLGAFNPFERISSTNIPDKVLSELDGNVNSSNLSLGLFEDLNRIWIINNNKLILWDYINSENYSIIDEIPDEILAVKLVKPKSNTFVESVSHLLIVSTYQSIYILAISAINNEEIEIFNTGLSVAVNSLIADNFVWFEKTGQIFFTGRGDDTNIWELTYSNEDKWFDRKCNKRCLTRSSISNLIPMNGLLPAMAKESTERIVSLKIDESRNILYTLSSKSIIRAYVIKKYGLETPLILTPSKIIMDLRTTDSKSSKLLSKEWFTISSINIVTKNENDNLFFVAITQGGCRIYLNGALYGGKVAALRVQNIKFPPSILTIQEFQKQMNERRMEPQPIFGGQLRPGVPSKPNSLLELQKESLIIANTTSKSKIISPGIFVAAVQNSNQDKENNKLFVSVPDYGFLNYYHAYVENSTFLENYGIIYDIAQLTPTIHATDTPNGYANLFATQYTSTPLHFAVLTNKGVSIYKQRTPSTIFSSLGEQTISFVDRYGLQEACSTALSIICNERFSDSVKFNMFNFFSSVHNFTIENKPIYERPTSLLGSALDNNTYSTEHVKLSPRFYGIVLLISRIFRNIWYKNVFVVDKKSFLSNGTKNMKYLNETKQFLSGMSIDKNQAIGFLNTAVVLIKFFEEYGSRIPYFQTSLLSNRGVSRVEETAIQAEHTALKSVFDLVKIMKEAFSFLLILFDESLIVGSENQSLAFKDTVKYISSETQEKLSKLKFCDLFALRSTTKDIAKDVFTSIINKNISSGVSVDFLTESLQKHCSSFCSANDVIIFRGFEHLRKADSIGSKDNDVKLQELSFAVQLLKKVGKSLSIESLKDVVKVMIKLDYFPEVIEFVLDIANIIDKDKVAMNYVNDGFPLKDERQKIYNMKIERFRLIFDILVEVDVKVIESYENFKKTYGNDPIVLEISKLRDQSYSICFKYNDKLFHYEFYDWFVKQGLEKKLLEIDTPFILPYLKEERSANSAEIRCLLSKFYAKRQYYFEAAEVLYQLAISNFDLPLNTRVEYLAKASGYCNCVEQFSLRQQTVELLKNVQNNLDVAGIQLELIDKLQNDTKLTDEQKFENTNILNQKILDISSLYNEFADPFEYDDLCLIIFKESDYRSFEEIIKKWDSIFSKIEQKYKSENQSGTFNVVVANTVIAIGRRVSSSEVVFPISVLIEKLLTIFENYDVASGSIVDIFIKSGISYNRLYYILRHMIETGGSKYQKSISSEMVYLIQSWWNNDPRLKEVISANTISSMTVYSLTNDPVNKFINQLDA